MEDSFSRGSRKESPIECVPPSHTLGVSKLEVNVVKPGPRKWPVRQWAERGFKGWRWEAGWMGTVGEGMGQEEEEDQESQPKEVCNENTIENLILCK